MRVVGFTAIARAGFALAFLMSIPTRSSAEVRNVTVESRAYLMVVGDEDQEYQSNVRFHQFLDSIGVRHEFVVLKGFGHNGRVYADERTGMRFLSEHFKKASAGR